MKVSLPTVRSGPNDGAFPVPNLHGAVGITAREWFAGMALIGLLANPSWNPVCYTFGFSVDLIENPHSMAAHQAYQYADAMLASPDKRKEE